MKKCNVSEQEAETSMDSIKKLNALEQNKSKLDLKELYGMDVKRGSFLNLQLEAIKIDDFSERFKEMSSNPSI